MNRDDVKLVLNGTHKLTRRTAIALAEALLAVMEECEKPAAHDSPPWQLATRTASRRIEARIEEIPLP